jgi:hypothetical protein
MAVAAAISIGTALLFLRRAAIALCFTNVQETSEGRRPQRVGVASRAGVGRAMVTRAGGADVVLLAGAA